MSEGLVKTYLQAQGFEVFVPGAEHGRIDLIYNAEGRPIRVQVKTSCWVQGGAKFAHEQAHLTTSSELRLYAPEEIDEIWVVGTHLWAFPIGKVAGKTTLNLNTNNPKPRKTYRDYNPNDFIVVAGNIERPFKNRLLFDDPEPSLCPHNTEYSEASGKVMKYRRPQ